MLRIVVAPTTLNRHTCVEAFTLDAAERRPVVSVCLVEGLADLVYSIRMSMLRLTRASSMTSEKSLRYQLKHATQLEHSAAETLMFGVDFAFSAQQYESFLKAMLGVHTTYGLSSAAALCSESDRARELQFIKAIQQDLNMPKGLDLDSGSYIRMSDSFAIGVRYAISGSSIGSTKMLRLLSTLPGIGSEYLRLSAVFCKTDLKIFFDKLDQCSIDLPEAILGAKSVFRFVETAAQTEAQTELRHRSGN